jgi:hypothetical protein
VLAEDIEVVVLDIAEEELAVEDLVEEPFLPSVFLSSSLWILIYGS